MSEYQKLSPTACLPSKRSRVAEMALTAFKAQPRRVARASRNRTPSSLSPKSLSRARALPILPPELYRLIIEWVSDRSDLSNLCLTSKVCRVEAERILYRTIELPQNTYAPALWAQTILSFPQKAAAVRSLTWRFDLAFLIVPHTLLPSLQLISRALAALRGLKLLYLIGHARALMHPIYLWLLDGCAPNLEGFHNSVFSPSYMLPFLSRQPNIRRWTQPGIWMEIPAEVELLPQLAEASMHASALALFTIPRPLRRLRLNLNHLHKLVQNHEFDVIQRLSLFGETLECLTIENLNSRKFTINHLLHRLADATPNLKTLAFTGLMPYETTESNYKGCIPLLKRFSKLEILALPLSGTVHSSSATWLFPTAEALLSNCPSLRHIVFRGNRSISYQKRGGGNDMVEGVVPDCLDT